MKIAAIIAEYNPFHNGHLYQIETIKNQLGADYIIVVMSGNFVQRGAPAIIDKFSRCRMALENGADLVFELPVYFALGSAEYFAQGAVSLLDKLGIVDFLHFGSESGDIDVLSRCAREILEESGVYQENLRQQLRQGVSFPTARSRAINAENFSSVLESPNNILAIEYIKALLQRDSHIKPVTLLRKGNGYHQADMNDNRLASANAIRSFLQNNEDITTLQMQLPHSVYSLLVDNQDSGLMYTDDFSTSLYYKLLSDSMLPDFHGFDGYYDVTPQLSDTFIKNLNQYISFSGFCLSCKSRNYTLTRISRCLTHIILNMKQDIIQELKAADYCQYARLLGFSKNGQEILKSIKSNTSIPIISKLPKAEKELEGVALSSLKADINASQLYYMQRGQKYHRSALNEYTQEIIRIYVAGHTR